MRLCKHTRGRLPAAPLLLADIMGRAIGAQEEFVGVVDGGAQEGGAIAREFGDRFAEVEGVVGPLVDGEEEVVCREGADDGGAAFLDGLDGGRRGAVFEDDFEGGELAVEGLEGGEEGGFGVEDRDVFFVVRGTFAVEVEDQSFFLHGGKDGVEGFVGEDA